MPVAQALKQAHHGKFNFDIRHRGNVAIQEPHLGVELRLGIDGVRHQPVTGLGAKRVISLRFRPSREKREIVAPALCARHARRVHDAEKIVEAGLVAQRTQTIVAARVFQISVAPLHCLAQPPHSRGGIACLRVRPCEKVRDGGGLILAKL